jgi:3-hydroxybutyryl-CoA dehydrogenase
VTYRIIRHGLSRSFPKGDPFAGCGPIADQISVHLGVEPEADVPADAGDDCALVEVDLECLGIHTGEAAGSEGDCRVGFARWAIGDGGVGDLVEVVVQANTHSRAVELARTLFTSAGFTVVVCRDSPGRILDRLLRPYLNDALRGLDRCLASASDLDKTVRLGLGYPLGPVELLESTGMARHHRVSSALFEAYGETAFVPARRSVVAATRAST